MRFLFVGNDITVSPVNSVIGWDRSCGMAASCEEKDYVHIVMDRVRELFPGSVYEAVNVSEYEKNYLFYDLTELEPYRDFEADVIIVRLLENVDREAYVRDNFGKHYERIINYLNKRGAIILCTGSFWKNDEGDEIVKRISVRNGYTYVPLSSLDAPEYRADGQFADKWVAAHPSDKGMRAIADLLIEQIERRFA